MNQEQKVVLLRQEAVREVNKNTSLALPKWNWGAFFLTWIWAAGNGFNIHLLFPVLFIVVYSLSYIIFGRTMGLFYIPFIFTISYALFCGINGNKWVWIKKKFSDVESLKKDQANWKSCGFTFIFLVLFFFSLWAIFVVSWTHGYGNKCGLGCILGID